VHALDGVSLTFPSRGLVFISGKSGSGKTTLLNVIGGLDGIDGGEIYVQDKEFSTFTAKEYDSYRNTFIGFVFQEYNLLSEFTVEYNIKIAMELQGGEVDEEEFSQLLQEMEIQDLKDRKPSELSGGQRQRVAIARALLKKPRIIMADEPTGALDSATGAQVLDMLKKLSKDKLVIVVSHDNEFAQKYADRIIHLIDGQVVEDITFTETDLTENVSERENALIVRDGAELSENEKNALAKAVKERKKIEIIEKLSFRDKQKTGEVAIEREEPVALKKSKMKFKSSAQMGVKSLAVKPIRLFITVLISALAFAVFGLFDTIANFNTEKILKHHLRKSSAATLVADAEYIVDYTANDTYVVKVSNATLEALESETGGAVKGIFDFRDNTSGNVAHTQQITELTSSKVVVGRKYYANAVNGFIEFDADTEIDGKTFKDFDYKLIKGEYPRLAYENGNLDKATLYNVAISAYLADSIIFYLNGEPLNGKTIQTYDDLLLSQITIGQDTYTIVGIVDCGEISEKYDTILQSTPSNVNTTALLGDYTSFIDSSAQKCLFVGKGFMREYNKLQQSADIYYGGNADWSITVGDSDVKKQVVNYMYNAEQYTKDNILLFSGRYSQDGLITLADDEILVHYLNLEYLFSNEISHLEQLDKNLAKDMIRSLQNGSVQENRNTFDRFCALLNLNIQDGFVSATVQSRSTETDEKIVKDWKIVGVYFGVDNNSYSTASRYKLMVGKSFMQSYHIYEKQGDYNKILFSKESVKNGADVIVKYLSTESGFALNWYNNSVLLMISENETMIRQAADLFLYAALALAVFSIFMLYNYISTSISSKRRSVGVLRGLGAGGKDILRIFLTESLIIAFINGVLACALSAVGCMLVNSYIMNTMNIFVAFALFGVRQILIISGVSLLTAFVSSALPIFKISKKKPVDLIRRS
jgi:ABC-type lipoprotein export system ATPase subunit/ABC-type antimicrobial peptide transport system permease subunit